MTRISRILAIALVAVLGVGGAAFAAPVKSQAHSLIGTLDKVDGQTLTVKTAKGSETVMLAPTARIHRASKTLAVADLASHTGDRVKVRYMESGGQKQAQSVTLSSAAVVKKTAKK